ncbi:MAG: phosphatidylglycerol lysyltransferase domain-containing protein [Bacillota bacterium]|nr:phosphatidylglycerol lysyltransferase domain-containing protein [Bacillota bacterium]
MIDFKEVEIDDKNWIDPLLAAADMRGSQHNFTNIFTWSVIFNYRAAEVGDYLVVKGSMSDGAPFYLYPAGQGNLKLVFDAMREDSVNCGHEFILLGLFPENKVVLDILFPSSFTYTEMRDGFDYVYHLDQLVTLAGRKFSAKRNHINRFKKNYNWAFELISPENLAECWEMNVEWCKAHGCDEDVQLTNEYCAVRRCFENYTELDLEGGLLRIEGKVVAFTMGERLNSDTYDIHIEKAFDTFHGAYQMINREFAALVQKKYPELIYVNREEDMGFEGLRKAKLSYYPVRMEEKYIGKFVG